MIVILVRLNTIVKMKIYSLKKISKEMTKKRMCSFCGKIYEFSGECSCKNQRKKFYKLNDDGFYSTRKWRKKRSEIIERDGGYCRRCYAKYGLINTDNLTVHHIKSREHYPELSFDDSNLICICMTCNNTLGTKDILDFNWDFEEEFKNYII